VKLAFYLLAAAMVALALALLLLPLVRSGRKLGRPRGVFALALAVAFVVPLAAAGLYLAVGTPVALDGVPRQDQSPMGGIDAALAQLQVHLAQQPGDAQGWQLLAQTYVALRRPADARDAYGKLLELDPADGVAMVGWAEADSMARDDHLIEGRARELLERAVQADPKSQRGLWLLGISQFQHGQYAEAAATWRRLQPMLEAGSTVAQAVAQQIAAADARVHGAATPAEGGSAAPPAGSAAQNASAAAGSPAGPALQVQVALAPSLKDKLGDADATVFVYARAEHGPPMPLAVARLDARALPAAVTLTDAMAMTPSFRLSSAPRVFVGARISRSGQAIAQPGDLEGDAGVVATGLRTPVKVLIDKVHP
jgi:cytochrome c-type biogenesis protein CcmH